MRLTKVAVAAILEIANGILSLTWAAIAIAFLARGGTIAALGRAPLALVAALLAVLGLISFTFGLGLWQRSSWARTGSFIAGALGVPVGLVAPLPVLSAILNLVMIVLLRDSEMRDAYEPATSGEVFLTAPTDHHAGVGATRDERSEPAPAYRASQTPARQPTADVQPYHAARRFEQEMSGSAQQHTLMLKRGPQYLTWLIPTTGPQAGEEFRLGDVMTVGRDRDNDVVLDDDGISGRHLRVRREDGDFTLIDQATTNGTLVNGEPVVRHTLQDGDLVKIGSTTLLFLQVVTDEQPAAGQPEGG
jgi:hypothetical protein